MDKIMSLAAKKVISEKTASLELIQGTKKDRTPFFAYVLMKESDANILREKKKDISLPENSIVLYSDFGQEVPEGVEEKVMAEYKKLFKDSE